MSPDRRVSPLVFGTTTTVLLIAAGIGWALALSARADRAKRPRPCPEEPSATLPAEDPLPAPKTSTGKGLAEKSTRSLVATCFSNPEVRRRILQLASRNSRAEVEKALDTYKNEQIDAALQRHYQFADRRKRVDAKTIERICQQQGLDSATRDKLARLAESYVDAESKGFVQFKEGTLSDRAYMAQIKQNAKQDKAARRALLGEEGLALYDRIWTEEFKKEMAKMDKEEGF